MTVMMTYLRTASAVSRTGPITTGVIAFFPREVGGTIIFRAGQYVMLITANLGELENSTQLVNFYTQIKNCV